MESLYLFFEFLLDQRAYPFQEDGGLQLTYDSQVSSSANLVGMSRWPMEWRNTIWREAGIGLCRRGAGMAYVKGSRCRRRAFVKGSRCRRHPCRAPCVGWRHVARGRGWPLTSLARGRDWPLTLLTRGRCVWPLDLVCKSAQAFGIGFRCNSPQSKQSSKLLHCVIHAIAVWVYTLQLNV